VFVGIGDFLLKNIKAGDNDQIAISKEQRKEE
jgi:hypothetical protein